MVLNKGTLIKPYVLTVVTNFFDCLAGHRHKKFYYTFRFRYLDKIFEKKTHKCC